MKYIYSISQMSKLSLILCTFSITSSVAGLFLTQHTKSALTSISDFFLSSEVVAMWQTDGTAHKLKPRSFHKSIHL